MSKRDTPPGASVVWAVVVLFLGSLAAVVVLSLRPGEDITALVGSVFTNLAAIVAVLVNVQRTNAVGAKVDHVEDHTSALVNGLLDSKVRSAVAEVMHPDLIDPAAQPQLAADKVKRDAYDAASELARRQLEGDK